MKLNLKRFAKRIAAVCLTFAALYALLLLGGCNVSADISTLPEKPDYFTQEDWEITFRFKSGEIDFWSESYEVKAARQKRISDAIAIDSGKVPGFSPVYRPNSLDYLSDPAARDNTLANLKQMRQTMEGNTDPALYGFFVDRWTVEEALKAIAEFGAIPDEDLNMFQQGWLYSAEGWLRMVGMEGATMDNYTQMPAYIAAAAGNAE